MHSNAGNELQRLPSIIIQHTTVALLFLEQCCRVFLGSAVLRPTAFMFQEQTYPINVDSSHMHLMTCSSHALSPGWHTFCSCYMHLNNRSYVALLWCLSISQPASCLEVLGQVLFAVAQVDANPTPSPRSFQQHWVPCLKSATCFPTLAITGQLSNGHHACNMPVTCSTGPRTPCLQSRCMAKVIKHST